jgi:hypothetical protein
MPSLYELTGARLALQSRLEDMNFDSETILDTLEGESTEIAKKVEDYVYVIRNRQAFTQAMQAEIDRMTERKNAEVKRIEAIEAWLLQNMIACDFKKVECAAFTITVQNNPQKVDVLDEKQIPADYWRTPSPKPPVASPDKKLILQALKDGFDVPGCAMVQTARLVVK